MKQLGILMGAIVIGALIGAGPVLARDWVVDNKYPAASDTGSGTMESPLKTIGAAALKAEPGDRVLVRPGIYREAVAIPKSGTPQAPITYESEKLHEAIITGSDPAPANMWKEVEPGIWRAPWPELQSNKKYGNGEMVYVNGCPLLCAGRWVWIEGNPVIVGNEAHLMPGKFLLDFNNKAVLVMFEEGKDPSNSEVELAKRDGLFHPGNAASSQTFKKNVPFITDIVIRGFELINNADWFRGYGALRVSGERWLVEKNHIKWGTRFGLLTISSSDCVFKDNIIEWSGEQCIGGGSSQRLRFENNIVRFGNISRSDPDYGGGGSKFSSTMDSLFKGNIFQMNCGSGLWFDGANDSNMIVKNRAEDNFGSGSFFSEISWGDMYIENISAYNITGFEVGESPATVLTRNIVLGNRSYGVHIRMSFTRGGNFTREGLANEEKYIRETLPVPGISETRFEQWKARHLQYFILPKQFICNNCAVYDNIFMGNNFAYYEDRIYGVPNWKYAGVGQNFSDYNIFWARDKRQVFFYGPAEYVYPDGLKGWQKASGRDGESVVSDPQDPRTALPEWARDTPILKEPLFRLTSDLEQAGYNIVYSPETALLYSRLRRAKTLEQIVMPSSALRGCAFDIDGEKCAAFWAAEDKGCYYFSLKTDADSLIVENSYGKKTQRDTSRKSADLSVDYRPVYVRGLKGAVHAFSKLEFNVRKFNGIGHKIPVSVSVSNQGDKAASYDFVLSASTGFTPKPALLKGSIEPGKTAELKAEIIPSEKISGTLFRTRFAGTIDGKKLERLAQFAIGEGAGTIPYAKNAIKLDGETDDWGDLSKTVPLIQLADFRLSGMGDEKKWSGPDDLSAKFHAVWNEKGIYWLLLVKDDHPLACPDGVHPYESDAVEIFIDGRSPEMQWDTNVSEGTAQIVITPALDGKKSKYYLRPGNQKPETATKKLPDGYVLEGFIPFDAAVFPAGEWKPGRALKLALHILDRDSPALLGKGYNADFKGLEWGATWDDVNVKKAQKTYADASGWKILTLE